MLIKIKNTDVKYLEVYNQKLKQYYKTPFLKLENANFSVYLPITRFYINKEDPNNFLFTFYAKETEELNLYNKKDGQISQVKPDEFALKFGYEIILKNQNSLNDIMNDKHVQPSKPKNSQLKQAIEDYNALKNTITENNAKADGMDTFEAIKKLFENEGAN